MRTSDGSRCLDRDQAIVINPSDPDAYIDRGNAYDSKGQHDRAIADYNQAFKLNPRDANAYFNRGLAYRRKGDNDRAIADYRKVLSIKPNHSRAKDALKRMGIKP